MKDETKDYTEMYNSRPYLLIEEWSVDDIQADTVMLGLGGSPTKVKKIENVVVAKKDGIELTAVDKDIEFMMKELINAHIIG